MELPPIEPGPMEPIPAHPFAAPRGHAGLAWFVILVIVAFEIFLASQGTDAPGDDTIDRLLLRIQSQYLVGTTELTGDGGLLYPAIQQLNAGPVSIRQRFIVVAGELAGRDEAQRLVKALDDLVQKERSRTAGSEDPFVLTEDEAAVQQVLRRLYAEQAEAAAEAAVAPDPAPLASEDRVKLEDSLGWFGELALAPADGDPDARAHVMSPARRTLAAIVAFVGMISILGVVGFIGLVIVFVLIALRRLPGGLRPGHGHHGLYAETFAVWLALFLLLQLGVAKLGVAPNVQFPLLLGAFFASLAALAWPVLRGLTWREVREDIGWTCGRGIVIETLYGLACYPMALPVLAVGLVFSYMLIILGTAGVGEAAPFAPSGAPAHPIVAELDGTFMTFLPILLLGSVAAPIVEETMFRGVLYRHMRDATASLRILASTVLSGLASGIVFAMVHPQGWMAVPALASLALAFALAREWRRTLIAPVIMHAASNGIVLSLLNLLVAA